MKAIKYTSSQVPLFGKNNGEDLVKLQSLFQFSETNFLNILQQVYIPQRDLFQDQQVL